ncbi:hypothetical protein CPC08DRAFT_728986 [Agrocybe pediades]|nr:hypothetical protein CPC08DRAFT_728986 [Agrocybe pediades]
MLWEGIWVPGVARVGWLMALVGGTGALLGVYTNSGGGKWAGVERARVLGGCCSQTAPNNAPNAFSGAWAVRSLGSGPFGAAKKIPGGTLWSVVIFGGVSALTVGRDGAGWAGWVGMQQMTSGFFISGSFSLKKKIKMWIFYWEWVDGSCVAWMTLAHPGAGVALFLTAYLFLISQADDNYYRLPVLFLERLTSKV